MHMLNAVNSLNWISLFHSLNPTENNFKLYLLTFKIKIQSDLDKLFRSITDFSINKVINERIAEAKSGIFAEDSMGHGKAEPSLPNTKTQSSVPDKTFEVKFCVLKA